MIWKQNLHYSDRVFGFRDRFNTVENVPLYRIESALLEYRSMIYCLMKKKVLIVEDVADVRAMMKILVETYGYQAITADDGYEAIEMVREHQPDLILMDLMMPVLDGVMAVSIIRNIEGKTEVPIIALTAYQDIYQKKAMTAGCDAVITKPLNLDRLQPLLNHYLH
jgi:CheY-like chemotaxis protein